MATEEPNTSELAQHAARMDELKHDGASVAENALIDSMRTALRVLILTATLAVKIQEDEQRHGRDIGDLKKVSTPGRLIMLESRMNQLEQKLAKAEEQTASAQSDNHAALAGDVHGPLERRIDGIERMLGTPDDEDPPVVQQLNDIWTKLPAAEKAIAGLAKRYADQHAAATSTTVHVEQLTADVSVTSEGEPWIDRLFTELRRSFPGLFEPTITEHAEVAIGAKDRGDLSEALDKLLASRREVAALDAQAAGLRGELTKARGRVKELEDERTFGEWRGQLRKDFDDEITRLSRVHQASMSNEHKRIAALQDASKEQALALDVQTKELETLREQLAAANARADAADARAEADRVLLDERARRLETTQRQIDKFMGACGDQAIQIMELRGEIHRVKPLLDTCRAWRTNSGTTLYEVGKAIGELFEAERGPVVATSKVTSEPGLSDS